MSYRDELNYDYEHPEKSPYRSKEQWMDVLEEGNLTHADVMRLVAERDILDSKFKNPVWMINLGLRIENRKLAEERDFYYIEYSVLREIAENTKWISVEERIPSEQVRVITYLDGEILIDVIQDGTWYLRYGVTHWMPMPMPEVK